MRLVAFRKRLKIVLKRKEISKMEKYVVPNIEIIEFVTEDVITTSGNPVLEDDEVEIMRP